jgi:hypothetical protein
VHEQKQAVPRKKPLDQPARPDTLGEAKSSATVALADRRREQVSMRQFGVRGDDLEVLE